MRAKNGLGFPRRNSKVLCVAEPGVEFMEAPRDYPHHTSGVAATH
jgi:hypothetical protein